MPLVEGYLEALTTAQSFMQQAMSRTVIADADAEAPLQAMFNEWGEALERQLEQWRGLATLADDNAQRPSGCLRYTVIRCPASCVAPPPARWVTVNASRLRV